jgi:cell division protein FtsW
VIQIPFVGISFQPSTLASVVCFVFQGLDTSSVKPERHTLKSLYGSFGLPVFITFVPPLPVNSSTTALILQ